MGKAIYILTIFIFLQSFLFAQETEEKTEPKTLFGIQFSPILPFNLVKNNDLIQVYDSISSFELNHKTGYLYGMELRHEFNRNFAVQGGINFIRRNIDITFVSDTTDTTRLQFIGYEIPLMALVFLRLSRTVYMDNAVGFCFNFYPSDIVSGKYYGVAKHWYGFGLLANVGWELRTEKNGYIYLGGTYQLQFGELLHVLYFENEIYGKGDARLVTGGSYFSANLKYYFPYNKGTKRAKRN